MNFVAVLGAFATIFSAGFGAVRLIGMRQGQRNFKTQFAFSWILGTGIVSLLVWIFGFLIRGALLPGIVAIVCLVLPWLAWRVSARAPKPAREARPLPRTISLGRLRSLPSVGANGIEIALWTILALEIATMFYLSFVHTLGTDGILNWEIKARYAYANDGALPASYLQDSGRTFSHPEYPLGIPYTELWLYFWLGDTNQFWAKTIFPVFYAAGAILLVAIGTQLTGRNSPGLISAVLLFFVPQMSIEGGSALVGYVDFPLSVFYLGAIGSLLVAWRNDERGWFGIYAACLALLPWIKREGVVLWLVAAVCGAFVILHKRKSYSHFLALLPGLLVMAGWRFYLSRMHAASSPDFFPINFATFGANIHRAGPIASRFFAEITNTQIWSLFWFLTAIASIFFVRRYRDARVVVIFAAIVAPIVIYAFGYIFSAWPDYLAHIGLSISRLLMHVAPLALLIIAAALPVGSQRTATLADEPRVDGRSKAQLV
jgi:hypothetical protein